MTVLTALGLFNYGLVLIYGLFLSVSIAGGCSSRRQKKLIFAICPVFLLIQSPCWLYLGVRTVKQLYPLIVHFPLLLIMVFALKKPLIISIVSICTSYLCCQLPRCVNIAVAALAGSELIGEIVYTILIAPIFILLQRYFVPAANNAITDSKQSLILFGSLPVSYYLFDYATTIYSDALYSGFKELNELLPTILILFYVAFLAAYRAQMQKRTEAELQSSMLETEMKQAKAEMSALRRSEMQSAIYRHDMRHHLSMISSFLTTGENEKAVSYIQKIMGEIEAIAPKRFCENEAVNLLCSSFSSKAERMGVQLTIDARLPKELSISDTELCTILSNGLENALHAVSALSHPSLKNIELSCSIRLNKLLIEIKNPFSGEIQMRDGLPVSDLSGHGYGCRSVQAIAQQHGGLCIFEAEDGIFRLRLMLPLSTP